jgi:hypothetical protein
MGTQLVVVVVHETRQGVARTKAIGATAKHTYGATKKSRSVHESLLSSGTRRARALPRLAHAEAADPWPSHVYRELAS